MLDVHAMARTLTAATRTSWQQIPGNGKPCGLQVTLARVRRCPPSKPPGDEVAPGQWLLEVVARAAEGAHPAAARAIGAPHVRGTGVRAAERSARPTGMTQKASELLERGFNSKVAGRLRVEAPGLEASAAACLRLQQPRFVIGHTCTLRTLRFHPMIDMLGRT